ncbi:MAG: T9SS type A sorting domain-containing protein, partial [Sphingobacteriales bacterium]
SIYNGEGPDFAVFENAFANPDNDTQAYLEMAFVEVSSDGTNFFRFPATSAMQDTFQIDNFSYSDAGKYHNLAGKYISHYGTPFDLEELKDVAGLDVDHVTHIRIVDVSGTIDPQYASHDKDGHIINDPYPSPYPSGGFDLNAVGVLHSNAPPTTGIAAAAATLKVSVYPNPATDKVYVHAPDNAELSYRLSDISGRALGRGKVDARGHISLAQQARGLYILQLSQGLQQATIKINKL